MHPQVGKTSFVFLILVNVLRINALVPQSNTQGQDFDVTSAGFVSVRRENGERTVTLRLGGLSAIETATAELPRTADGRTASDAHAEPNFIFREVTDGRELVQVVYDGSYTPKNCFLSADRETVQDVLSRVHHASLIDDGSSRRPSPGHFGTKNPLHPLLVPKIVNNPESLLPDLKYVYNASEHTVAYVQLQYGYDAGDANTLPPLLNSMIRLDLIKSQCQRLQSEAVPSPGMRRHRRGLLTYPKTLWCGQGTEATHYDQLGEEASADMCCRAHDHCPHLQIGPFEKKLFLRNVAPHAISDCRCDKMFAKCLKKAGTPTAMGVGDVYFNRLKIKCFVTRKKRQCLEASWLGTCVRREKTDTAVLRDARPFPEGKNLTKAEKALRRKRRRELLELN